MGASFGELFVLLFVLAAVISFPLWPGLGERIAVWLVKDEPDDETGAPSDDA